MDKQALQEKYANTTDHKTIAFDDFKLLRRHEFDELIEDKATNNKLRAMLMAYVSVFGPSIYAFRMDD